MNSPSRFLVAFGLVVSSHAAIASMTLGEALQRAVERDPYVDASMAAYAAEAELGKQERAGLRPSVSIEAQGYQNRSDSRFAFGQESDTYPSWSAYLLARQPLLRMDWSARGDRAELRDALAAESLADRRAQFVVRLCLRYLDTLLAEDRVLQAESEARAVRESLNDTRKRYEVELVPGTDLKEAQARDDLAQAELVAQHAALEDARDALQEVTGYDRAPLPAIRENLDFPPLVPARVEGWIEMAAKHNSARRLAEMQVQLAKTNVESRKAEALPAVDLVAEAGRNDSTEYTLGQRQDDARVGLELKVPVYAGGLNRARVREAEARLREAEAEFERVSLETERSMRNYFRAVETARAQATAYGRALDSALLAQKAVAAGYDAGTRTITDVLDAKSRVVNASRTRNESRLNLLITLLQLNAASGTLTAEMVLALDPLLFDVSR
jgi:outer membrane protein